MKGNARKVRRSTRSVCWPASPARPPTPSPCFERFEAKLEKHSGHLTRGRGGAGEGLAHRPHAAPPGALLCVADRSASLIISGTGDVIEPEHDLMAIGSGGAYAQAAAPRAARAQRAAGARHRREGPAHRRGHLRVYQPQPRDRGAGRRRLNVHGRHHPPRDRPRARQAHHRQDAAKRAVAIALRNRWRRLRVDPRCATRSLRRTS